VIHTAQILRLSEDLPLVVEVVDSEEQIEKLKPILDEMVREGLVTMEKVHVLRYSSGAG
jgi:PII-like signaling protein